MITDTDSTALTDGSFSGGPSRLLALLSFGFEFAHGFFEQRDREDASIPVLVQLPDGHTE